MRRVSYLCFQDSREGQASFTHVHEIVKGLRKRGWVVDIFEPSYPDTVRTPTAILRLWQFIRIQWSLWLRGDPDVLYIRWHFASWPTALWGRLRGVRVVQEVNGPYEDLFLAWPWTRRFAWVFVRLMRSQLRWAHAVVAVTPQLASWVRKETGQASVKLAVIPNGAETELFHPLARPDPSVLLDKPYVIFFGTLARWQGIETMLEAVEHREWPREVSLVIVGDGVEREKIEAAAKRTPRITYLGRQPHRSMPGLVASSLGALSPKAGAVRRETGLFPLKVLEALACGVPVIVTDFPGVADIVRRGKCGLVIPPEDPGALARAVAHLYGHPTERATMGKVGRQLVEAEHTWDRRAEETSALLEDLLSS